MPSGASTDRARRLRRLGALMIVAAGGVSAGLAMHAATATASATERHIVGDFNGDGHSDLAIGDPANSNAGPDSGAVSVLYGSATGVRTMGAQYFDPATPGWPTQFTPCTTRSHQTICATMGSALATGDFNHDGYADLAIGAPSWNFDQGGVLIAFGSPSGLSTRNSQFLPAPSGFSSLAGTGFKLAAGDFNHDGFDDLAISAIWDVVNSTDRAGALWMASGSAAGLVPGAVITEATAGMPGPPVAYDDEFGWSLAAGDFNRDGYTDLAVGTPGKSAVIVLYGSASGLGVLGSQYLQGIGPYAAYAVAAGDFNGNGFSDLAVGESCAGSVEIHYGGTSGLGSVNYASAQAISTTSKGMPPPGGGQRGYFGYSLVAGDFNGDGRADLVVSGAGSGSYVLLGSSRQLSTTGSRYLAGVGTQPSFGVADLKGNGIDDLVTGNPYYSDGGPLPHVDIRYGSTGGLRSTPAASYNQTTPGLGIPPGGASTSSWFGYSFSAPGSVPDSRYCGP